MMMMMMMMMVVVVMRTSVGESIRENMEASATESLGYYELNYHKP
jgi:hypothetical protein